MEGGMDGWIDNGGRMDRLMIGGRAIRGSMKMDAWKNRWMGRWRNGWICGKTEGWMDG